MHIRRCFVVLGIVVRLLEGTRITTVSQTSTIEVDLKTDSQIVASWPRPTLTSTIKVNLTTTSAATSARRLTSTSTIGVNLTTASLKDATSARPTTSTSTIEVNLTTASLKEATSARPTTSTSTIDVNLTTASWTEATSARPTSLLRRIDVRKEDYVKRTTDVFYRRARNSKSLGRAGLYGHVWQWDYWCMLQPITGNCGSNRTKYYYNHQVNECLPHRFTGCKNNKNEFESIEECHNHCKGSALMPMPVYLPYNTDICKLQPISGRCLGQKIMYYYDVNENACKTFVYGGCAGNNNNFPDEHQCLDRCELKVTTTTVRNYDYLNIRM